MFFSPYFLLMPWRAKSNVIRGQPAVAGCTASTYFSRNWPTDGILTSITLYLYIGNVYNMIKTLEISRKFTIISRNLNVMECYKTTLHKLNILIPNWYIQMKILHSNLNKIIFKNTYERLESAMVGNPVYHFICVWKGVRALMMVVINQESVQYAQPLWI